MKLFRGVVVVAILAAFPAFWPVLRPVVSAQGYAESPASVTVYVSALDGNDSWSGRLAKPNCNDFYCAPTDGPFATFDRARAFVQSLHKAGLSQVNVQFRGGTYFLPATEMLTFADSGSPSTKIVYENYPGETPVISAGRRVQGWTRVGPDKWMTTQFPQTNFENLYYNGARRLRPRVAVAASSASAAYLGTYLRVISPVYVSTQSTNCPNLVAGKYECLDRFQYGVPPSPGPLSSHWKNLTPPMPLSPGITCDASNGSTAPVGDIELVD